MFRRFFVKKIIVFQHCKYLSALLKSLIKSLNRHAALTLSLCSKGQFKGAVVSFFYPCASVFWGNLEANSVPRARDPLVRVGANWVDEVGTRGHIGQKPKKHRARLKLAIYLKKVFIFEGITETGAETFVVRIRHIHVNLARKELHLSFLLSI